MSEIAAVFLQHQVLSTRPINIDVEVRGAELVVVRCSGSAGFFCMTRYPFLTSLFDLATSKKVSL